MDQRVRPHAQASSSNSTAYGFTKDNMAAKAATIAPSLWCVVDDGLRQGRDLPLCQIACASISHGTGCRYSDSMKAKTRAVLHWLRRGTLPSATH